MAGRVKLHCLNDHNTRPLREPRPGSDNNTSLILLVSLLTTTLNNRKNNTQPLITFALCYHQLPAKRQYLTQIPQAKTAAALYLQGTNCDVSKDSELSTKDNRIEEDIVRSLLLSCATSVLSSRFPCIVTYPTQSPATLDQLRTPRSILVAAPSQSFPSSSSR